MYVINENYNKLVFDFELRHNYLNPKHDKNILKELVKILKNNYKILPLHIM